MKKFYKIISVIVVISMLFTLSPASVLPQVSADSIAPPIDTIQDFHYYYLRNADTGGYLFFNSAINAPTDECNAYISPIAGQKSALRFIYNESTGRYSVGVGDFIMRNSYADPYNVVFSQYSDGASSSYATGTALSVESLGNGQYCFYNYPAAGHKFYLCGNAGAGSSFDTSATSPGNIYVSENNTGNVLWGMRWVLEDAGYTVNPPIGIASYEKFQIQNVKSGNYLAFYDESDKPNKNVFTCSNRQWAGVPNLLNTFQFFYNTTSGFYTLHSINQSGTDFGIGSDGTPNIVAGVSPVNFKFVYQGNGQYYLMTADGAYYLSGVDAQNGSDDGTLLTSPGNVIGTASPTAYSLWQLIPFGVSDDANPPVQGVQYIPIVNKATGKSIVPDGITPNPNPLISVYWHYSTYTLQIFDTYSKKYAATALNANNNYELLFNVNSGNNSYFKILSNGDGSVRIASTFISDLSYVLDSNCQFVPYTGAASQKWILNGQVNDNIRSTFMLSSELTRYIPQNLFPFDITTKPQYYTNGVLDWSKLDLSDLLWDGAKNFVGKMNFQQPTLLMEDPTVQKTLDNLQTSTVSVIAGHSGDGKIFFGNGGALQASDILSLPNGALKNCKLIVVLSCYMADSALTDALIEKGAQAVVAFDGNLNGSAFAQAYVWANAFFEALGNGGITPTDACAYAKVIVSSKFGYMDFGGTDSYVVYGADYPLVFQ